MSGIIPKYYTNRESLRVFIYDCDAGEYRFFCMGNIFDMPEEAAND